MYYRLFSYININLEKKMNIVRFVNRSVSHKREKHKINISEIRYHVLDPLHKIKKV